MVLVAPRPLQGCYFFCEEIAEGSFGTIYIAIHAITHQKVAIKILEKKKLGDNAFRVRSEIEAVKKLNHKYIYKLYQVTETESHFYLIFEYIPGGELFDYILQREKLAEPEAKLIFRQLVSAINYAHSQGIAHRDLKPENILLDNNQNIRVIDFGLCASNCDRMLNTFCGSLAYAAPEVLANQDYVGSSADIWSMGVILYALLCGSLPFDPNKPNELPQRISRGQFRIPDYLSKESKHLLTKMLCCDPKKRIKMDGLRAHPWLGEDSEMFYIEHEIPTMDNLNLDIVNEISAYTRIPRVEMVRMLKKRQYDYLMATYRIMETAYEEDGIFIRLHRREGAQRTFTRYGYADSSCRKVVSRPPATENKIETENSDSSPLFSGQHRLPSPKNVSLLKSGINKTPEIKNLLSKRSSILRSPCSPARRSVDSQIQQLTEELNAASNINSASVNNEDQRIQQSRTTSVDHVKDTRLIYPGDEMDNFTTSGFRLKRLELSETSSMDKKFEAITTASKNGSEISATWSGLRDPIIELHKLKKVNPSNNVVICRGDLSAGQIFDRLSSSLRERSIRFTLLKTSGFHCTIENDWGKVQLSFELELVRVADSNNKHNGLNLLRKKSSDVEKPKSIDSEHFVDINTKPRTKLHALSKKLRNFGDNLTNIGYCDNPVKECNSTKSSGTSVVGSQSSMGQNRPLIQKEFVLGIRMKRIHGDSYMHTSLCRSLIEMADIRVNPSIKTNI